MGNKSKKKTFIIIIAAVLAAAVIAAMTVIVLKNIGGDNRQTSMACVNVYTDEPKDGNYAPLNNSSEDWRKIKLDINKKNQYYNDKVNKLYMNYNNDIAGVIFVTHDANIGDGSYWRDVDNKYNILRNLQCTDAKVKNVIYLVSDDSGKINGVSYRIEDVFNGYKDGTWSFDNAKSDYEINAAKHKQ